MRIAHLTSSLIIAALILAPCLGDAQESEAAEPPRQGSPTVGDVAYGIGERQLLDFWKADSDEPTPVMIYFHGGGFRKGDKRQIRRDIRVEDYLAKGVSCISANYPFIDQLDVPTILEECENVLAFVLSKAEEWNLDPERIGVSGCSAGALIAFWVGVHHPEQVSVIGATMQPLGTEMLVPLMDESTPLSIIYQQPPDRNRLHAPMYAQMIREISEKNGVECIVYGSGENAFDLPPEGKDKFSVMMDFYLGQWGMK